MDKYLFQEMSPKDRIHHLEANADDVKDQTYMRELTPEELTQRKSQFTQESIEIAKIEDEKKKSMDTFKARLEPHKTNHKQLLQDIKLGAEEVVGRVYVIVDHEAQMAGEYNEQGKLITSRPATTQELGERTIMSITRSGTDS